MGTRISSQCYLPLVYNYAAYQFPILASLPEMATPSHVIFLSTVLLTCVLSLQFSLTVCVYYCVSNRWFMSAKMCTVGPSPERQNREERVCGCVSACLRSATNIAGGYIKSKRSLPPAFADVPAARHLGGSRDCLCAL